MRVLIIGVALAITTSQMAWAGTINQKEADRIKEATTALTEIHATPDKDVPQELWENAQCVIVNPGLKKAAFGIGGEYGRGLMSCRHEGQWSAPVFMEMEKGSWGFQIGAQSIDLVLLAMNKSGVEKLLNNKVSLGAEASVAAGPVGRDESTRSAHGSARRIQFGSAIDGPLQAVDLAGSSLTVLGQAVAVDADTVFHGAAGLGDRKSVV